MKSKLLITISWFVICLSTSLQGKTQEPINVIFIAIDIDNEEYNNLASDPEYKSVLENMKSLMDIALKEGKFKGE